MFDVVIANGSLVDGAGTPAYRADVGVAGDRITAIGDLSESDAGRVIDASGLVVAPGFVDTHTHSEGALLVDPQHANGLRQGITTELLGIDGMSYAPLSHGNYLVYRRWLGGLLGEPPVDLDMSTVAAFRQHYDRRVAVNTAYLVPHGTIRLETAGFRDVPLVGPLMDRAKRLVRQGMEHGALGLSTGSSYYPGPWSTTGELVELCKTVRDAGGVFMCEPRLAQSERGYGGGGVGEALEIARRSGVPLHLAHFRTDSGNAGRVGELMAPVDNAIEEGVDVTLDIYPYPTGSSIPVSTLPGWAQEGGPDAILGRLRDTAQRSRIVDYLRHERGSRYPLGEMVVSTRPTSNTWRASAYPSWRIGAASPSKTWSATCSARRTWDSATSWPRRPALRYGGSSAATPWSCSRGRTTWSAVTSRPPGAFRTPGRTARFLVSSAGSVVSSAGSASKPWSTG